MVLKIKDINTDTPETLLGFALWDENIVNLENIKKSLEVKFEINVELEDANNSLSLVINNETFVISHMPAPVPYGDAEKDIEVNYIDENNADKVKNHKSFFVVAKLKSNNFDKTISRINFSRVCGVLMEFENAVAMYMGGINLILPKGLYIQYADIIDVTEGSFLPIQLWVRISMYRSSEGNMARTFGLSDFDLKEICFYNTTCSANYLMALLLKLSNASVENGDIALNGEQVQFSPDHSAVAKIIDEENMMYFIEM